MFIPNYILSSTKQGFSGKHFWSWRFLNILEVYCRDVQIVSVGISPDLINFNPYRDMMIGGTTLGFRGRNYWISDSCLIGKILRLLFK